MSRRDRLERRLQKRKEWAEKAEARSAAGFERAREILAPIPPGQPILVGHHSEKRHRRALDRHDNAMRRSCEEAAKAKHHDSKADGLERQLDRSIFSDDQDAIAELEARIAERERDRDVMKATNAAWRKAGRPAADNAEGWAKMAALLGRPPEELQKVRVDFARFHWHNAPFPQYALTNLGGNIRRDRERIDEIKRRAEKQARVEAAGGIEILPFMEGRVQVTFAEKPDRATLDALKAAGFFWSGGSWHGERAKLPAALDETVTNSTKGYHPLT